MVAFCNIQVECTKNPKTLGDWVKNFRSKKMQMRRKISSSGNLRICAILSTALMTAELELRRKQQERFQKWLDFQTKINKNLELSHRHLKNEEYSQYNEEKDCKQNEEINNLWKCELSELDNFMRRISGSSSKNIAQSIDKSREDDAIEQHEKCRKNIETYSIRVSS